MLPFTNKCKLRGCFVMYYSTVKNVKYRNTKSVPYRVIIPYGFVRRG